MRVENISLEVDDSHNRGEDAASVAVAATAAAATLLPPKVQIAHDVAIGGQIHYFSPHPIHSTFSVALLHAIIVTIIYLFDCVLTSIAHHGPVCHAQRC